MTTLLPLMFGLFAFAQQPAPAEAHIQEDGSVVGHVVVANPTGDVRKLLGDTEGTLLTIEQDTLDIVSDSATPCEHVHRTTKGVWHPLIFESQRCESAAGWSEKLTKSEHMKTFASSWTVAEHPEGTLVTYTIVTELNLPVPQALVRRNLRKSAQKMLDQLATMLPKHGKE
jgi:hypothetical protein